jgi:hypothetical protein
MSMIDDFRYAWTLPSGEMPAPAVGFMDQIRDLKEAAIQSAFRSSAGPGSPFDIIGQYTAFIMVSWLDAQAAQACLPPHLELAPPAGAPAGMHPVMYSFGMHQRVHPRFFHLWSYDYAEALAGLPCVNLRHADGSASGPYYFMTAVRLNNRFAEEIGVALGFPKKLAYIDAQATTYSIRMEPEANPVMTGSFLASGGVFGSDFPNFQTIEKMVMQQPVISRSPLGSLVLTPFHIDTQNAVMFPANADFTIADNSMAGLPANRYRFPGLDVTAFQSCYHSIHDWTMSPPTVVGV